MLLKSINDISIYDLEYIEDSIRFKNFTSAFTKIRKYISFDKLKKLFDGVIGYSEYGGKEFVVYDVKNIKIIKIVK